MYRPLMLAEQRRHRPRFLGAEPGHRLVEQQHRWLGGERHAELELAVLAVRHPAATVLPRAAEADIREQPARRLAQPRDALGRRQNRKLCGSVACTASATLPSAVKLSKMLVIWNERASPSRARGAVGRSVMSRPSKWIRPASGRELAGQLADQRRLAGAVRADQRVHLALADVERDVVGRHAARRSLAQMLDLAARSRSWRRSRLGIAVGGAASSGNRPRAPGRGAAPVARSSMPQMPSLHQQHAATSSGPKNSIQCSV